MGIKNINRKANNLDISIGKVDKKINNQNTRILDIAKANNSGIDIDSRADK